MYQIVELMIPISFFILAFSIVYVVVTARHRERIAMIEAGMNPNVAEPKNKQKNNKLNFALLCLFVPLGIYVGVVFSEVYPIMRNKDLGLLFAFLFGGIALLISYFMDSKRENSESITQDKID
jgi:hypothetical protein